MSSDISKREITKLNEFIEKGYSASYKLENNRLRDLKTDKTFGPKDVTLIETHRYEGQSSPKGTSIIYKIHTNDGRKGTLLVPSGSQAHLSLDKFMKDVSAKINK